MPSSRRCGSPSITARSMNAPGSPSSALQMRYFCSAAALQGELPLLARREPAAAAAAKPAGLDRVADLRRRRSYAARPPGPSSRRGRCTRRCRVGSMMPQLASTHRVCGAKNGCSSSQGTLGPGFCAGGRLMLAEHLPGRDRAADQHRLQQAADLARPSLPGTTPAPGRAAGRPRSARPRTARCSRPRRRRRRRSSRASYARTAARVLPAPAPSPHVPVPTKTTGRAIVSRRSAAICSTRRVAAVVALVADGPVRHALDQVRTGLVPAMPACVATLRHSAWPSVALSRYSSRIPFTSSAVSLAWNSPLTQITGASPHAPMHATTSRLNSPSRRGLAGLELQRPLDRLQHPGRALHVAGRAAADLDVELARRGEAELVVERRHAVDLAGRQSEVPADPRHRVLARRTRGPPALPGGSGSGRSARRRADG